MINYKTLRLDFSIHLSSKKKKNHKCPASPGALEKQCVDNGVWQIIPSWVKSQTVDYNVGEKIGWGRACHIYSIWTHIMRNTVRIAATKNAVLRYAGLTTKKSTQRARNAHSHNKLSEHWVAEKQSLFFHISKPIAIIVCRKWPYGKNYDCIRIPLCTVQFF